jgi:hypothetical protein
MSFALWMLMGCGGEPETLEEKIEAFLEEHDLSPTACGTVDYGGACDAGGEAAVTCFGQALAACEPARLEAVFYSYEGAAWTTTFVLWKNGENCQVESWTDYSKDPNWQDEETIAVQTCYDVALAEQQETCDQFSMDCYESDCAESDCG